MSHKAEDRIAVHVGEYVRKALIPKEMTVSEAARLLGVGRPALSNFLNGKAALSPEMASRLAETFGANREDLLRRQAEFDAALRTDVADAVPAKPYVPTFLSVKARHIAQWAENQAAARRELPALVRKLVHSTGAELSQVDFPAYDNAERRGWDGIVEADKQTTWVPSGPSRWEFGCGAKPSKKADEDFEARTSEFSAEDRAVQTFVFVTPRNWESKTQWAASKRALNLWKDVRVVDASDIEQWLELSVPGQLWLAERLNLPELATTGFSSLEECWEQWSEVADPRLTTAMFAAPVLAHLNAIKKWLAQPPDRPFVVGADSTLEGLAFLSCIFEKLTEPSLMQYDRVAYFQDAETLRRLGKSAASFIPIVADANVERELGSLYRQRHCIVVRPRNAVQGEASASLGILSGQQFREAMQSLGVSQHDADRYERESGGSLTILRRRLSRVDAIKTPYWAADSGAGRMLIPMVLVGAWHSASAADKEILRLVGGRDYNELEASIAELRMLDDPPVWSIGQYRGVSSKIDSLFAVSHLVTRQDIDNFFLAAEYVLSEKDPALELPEDKRWAAGIYGKVRDHSGALRDGLCETLVILAVHGNGLFQSRLGFDVEGQVSKLIVSLLTPLTFEKLESQNHDLEKYAEAAPEAFLDIIEADLKRQEPITFGLLKPAETGILGSGCPRTSLLWALEGLAWDPSRLTRVSRILARLCERRIDDNWVNKPICSVQAVFRAWMPQTAASPQQRIDALRLLEKEFPEVAWQICVDQFGPGTKVGFHSHRPKWRSDASGHGEMAKNDEHRTFVLACLETALNWSNHSARTISDLIYRIDVLSDSKRGELWNLVDSWAMANKNNSEAQLVRDAIRRHIFARAPKAKQLDANSLSRAQVTYESLKPEDLVARHAWLFRSQWMHAFDEIPGAERLNHELRAKKVSELRSNALSEIWNAQKFDGVSRLVVSCGTPSTVGLHLAELLSDDAEARQFIDDCLGYRAEESRAAMDMVLHGFLGRCSDERRERILGALVATLASDAASRLLTCAPFGASTWAVAESCGGTVRAQYWKTVNPQWHRHDAEAVATVVDRLLEARRPRAAFQAVQFDWEEVETARLKKLLRAISTSNDEPRGTYQLEPHAISEALDSLNKRLHKAELSVGTGQVSKATEEMAGLEFLYLDAIADTEYGMPNLERHIGESPMSFFQAVAFTYKRDDGRSDPPELHIEDLERRTAVAEAAHNLLTRMTRLPGVRDEAGEIEGSRMVEWISEVRRIASEHGRGRVSDVSIGQLLGRADAGKDGVWPCEPVRQALESVGSTDIARGFVLGAYNGRGAHWRDEGGREERKLAAAYAAWSKQLEAGFPFTARTVMDISKMYERDAHLVDTEDTVRERLRS